MIRSEWARLLSILTACLLYSVVAAAADAAHQHTAPAAAKPAMSDQQQIASAMTAAPAKVAQGATIVSMDETGAMHTIRAGTNGFTCMADNPATPGPDPMCMDKNAMDWIHAYLSHQPPPAGKVGFMYMLAGGTDASNTDPYATAPTATNHWIKTGPHVMVLGADQAFYDSYPKGADPDTSAPYIMWAGTPYQHVMVPIK